ncbi:MAG TPA: hypothetical protein VF273_10130 [Pelobium sp.]
MSTLKMGMILCFIAIATSCSKDNKNTVKVPVITDPINNFFKGEVKPALTQNCYPGAYYRKMVTSKDYWLGIGGKVTLPTFTFDPDRTNPAKPGQYLDNPSIYLGGNMGGQETDIGMAWEVIKDANGNVSPDRKAFRPFLRRTQQTPNFINAPATADYYWYPGEEIEMSIQVVSNGKLKFIVEGAGKRYETDFDAVGYTLEGVGEFKRVNAIDQVGREGKPVEATKTKVENAVWKETYLFRKYNGEVIKVPAHSGRLTDMRCPSKSNFSISATPEELKKGAETININGAGY